MLCSSVRARRLHPILHPFFNPHLRMAEDLTRDGREAHVLAGLEPRAEGLREAEDVRHRRCGGGGRGD